MSDGDGERLMGELADRMALERMDYPEPPHKDSQLEFMRDVVREEDSVRQSKTANLKDEEVGRTPHSVLKLFRVASFAESEGFNVVSDYLRARAFQVSAASLGRRAKLIETLFTVRRESRQLSEPKETTKRTMFGTTIKERTGDV